MGHDGQEVVQAGPWDGPKRATFSCMYHQSHLTVNWFYGTHDWSSRTAEPLGALGIGSHHAHAPSVKR
jgi:hypothetical protein